MEPQNHSITKRTAHYSETQYIHCTYDTKEPPNHRTTVVVELEHLALNYGTAEPQHKTKNWRMHITQRHNSYTVLTIRRNHRTKVVVGLEDLALNYGTAEPQHNISHRTAHDTETQYLHGTYHTYSSEGQRNQSYCWTRAPSPRLWNSRSTTLEKRTITQRCHTKT